MGEVESGKLTLRFRELCVSSLVLPPGVVYPEQAVLSLDTAFVLLIKMQVTVGDLS